MLPRIKKRLQQAHRPATKRNQDTALSALVMFLIFHELEIKNITPVILLAFIEFLSHSGLAVVTIKNYISSLKSKLNYLGVKTSAFASPRVNLSLTSLEKNKIIQLKPKPIISPSQFELLFANTHSLPLKAFIRVAILLAYMAFLRISNLVPKSLNDYDSTRDIRRGDITINKGGISIFIRWAKSLQKYNQVATIPLFKLSNSPLCPLVNLQYLNTQYPVRPSDPLLSYYSGQVLNVITQAQLRAAFACIVSSANLDHNLTFHALRRSGASLAFASGVQFASIQAHGTWTSDALWAYIHHSARDAAVPALFKRVFST
jgi:integrase